MSTGATPLNLQCHPKKVKLTSLISKIAQRTINKLWLIHLRVGHTRNHPNPRMLLMWSSLSCWNSMLQLLPFPRICARIHNAEWAARYLAVQAWIFFSALLISDWERVFCCTPRDKLFFFLIRKSRRRSKSRNLLRESWAWAWHNNHSYSPNQR